MNAINNYKRWSAFAGLPENLKQELEQIAHNDTEIADRFGMDLEFGTGGLRGKLGAGTNRMNLYTVGKATQGLASYLKAAFQKCSSEAAVTSSPSSEGAIPSVAIAYDSRHMSPEFSLHAALVLAANGIRAYLFDQLQPTPILSFAVRHLKADAGIVITASHNPPDYNGYKVYGSDGGQILNEAAESILHEIRSIEDEFSVQVLVKEEAIAKGLLVMLDDKVVHAYLDHLESLKIESLPAQSRRDLKVVYTPLHGTGNIPVRSILKRVGYEQVTVVQEQELPDPNFSTVKSPNPEEQQAFTQAIELAKRTEAHLIMGTDPDTDRVGVVVRNSEGEYVVLTGNQTGGLLLDFLLKMRQEAGQIPANGVVLKTIVTSELGRVVADHYGLETEDTLTGFKFIAAKIGEFEQTGDKRFLFGYEESYGYLIDPFVRDKDAVQACLAIAEMAAYYLNRGMSLYDALLDLYHRAGFFKENLVSVTLPGQAGMQKIQSIMARLREVTPHLEGWQLSAVEDYLSQTRTELSNGSKSALQLPVSDVLKFFYSDGSWVAVRPSGTEPKIKLYIGVQAETLSDADDKLARLTEEAKSWLEV